jgi:AraC-like DNA-binding protein
VAERQKLPAAVLHGAGGPRPFRLHRQAPSSAAADLVDHLWAVEWQLPDGAEHTQEVLSYPCHHVTVEPDGFWVHGVVTRRFARTLSGRGRAIGAHLRVAGLARIVPGLRARTTTDQTLPAGDVLPDVVDGLAAVAEAPDMVTAADALDAWLAVRPRHHVPGGDLAEAAVALAQSDHTLTRVEDLAARLAVSPRTLQRHLGHVLGVSPKWVVRRARIHDALETANADHVPPDWADLAQRLGFTDQAHFTNTFTTMVGVPPARYVSRATLAAGAASPTPPAGQPSPSRR